MTQHGSAEQILNQAKALRGQLLNWRRTMHRCPEVGASLPETVAFVKKELTAMGYAPQELGGGVTAEIAGKETGRCILLRADMDALSLQEKTGLPFASENGAMHACGHDMHAAMLLGAARLLRDYQQELQGTVKLVFQPDEEGFTGAKGMLAAGVLEGPAPQAALALHVHSGAPSGSLLCGFGTFMAGCTLFRITVRGKGCHGAMPETGVDPVIIAAQICLALQELTSREIPAKTPAVITIGHLQAGELPNVIPETAVIEGTIRSFDRELSEQLLQRIRSMAEGIAAAFRGDAAVEEMASAPPLKNDPELMEEILRFSSRLLGERQVFRLQEGGMGSEDFASYTYCLPCAYLLLGAGTAEEDPQYGRPMHNEGVVFNEDVLPLGAALHTWCAMQWLAGEN